MKEIEENLHKMLIMSFKTHFPQEFKTIEESENLWAALGILLKYELPDMPEMRISEVQEALYPLRKLLDTTMSNIAQIHNILFPAEKDPLDDMDWIDLWDIYDEAKKYTDPSHWNEMSDEEMIKLINDNDPQFMKTIMENYDEKHQNKPKLLNRLREIINAK